LFTDFYGNDFLILFCSNYWVEYLTLDISFLLIESVEIIFDFDFLLDLNLGDSASFSLISLSFVLIYILDLLFDLVSDFCFSDCLDLLFDS